MLCGREVWIFAGPLVGVYTCRAWLDMMALWLWGWATDYQKRMLDD